MRYRRLRVDGGCYFFTVATHERRPFFASEESVNVLRAAFSLTIKKMPFRVDAIVVLPDHIHYIWTLPQKDHDYSTRWRLIKTRVSKVYGHNRCDKSLIWQKRYWEHLIRDEDDYKNHIDYIHYNPVKHGLVESVTKWKYSSYLKYLQKGIYSNDWGESDSILPDNIGRE